MKTNSYIVLTWKENDNTEVRLFTSLDHASRSIEFLNKRNIPVKVAVKGKTIYEQSKGTTKSKKL